MAAITLQNSDIIKGSKLMVFMKVDSVYTPVAFATSHNLSITMNTSEVSTKDHGDFPATLGQNITWEVTTENLYSRNGESMLWNAMKTMQPVQIQFAEATEYNQTSAEKGIVGLQGAQNWTPDSTHTIATGYALITSLSVNAPSGDNATLSATFTGTGELAEASSN